MSLFGSANFGLPRLKPLPSKRSHVVSVLDIGSTKVVCMIGRLTPRAESQILPGRTHSIEVIGIGHQKSRASRMASSPISMRSKASSGLRSMQPSAWRD